MGIILGIDSACASCSVALWYDGQLLAEAFEAMGRGQAARLVPMIGDVLNRASVAPPDLSAVGVTVGPGAFTGIRIGLATARGIGLAGGLPVVGITTTRAVAAAQKPEGRNVLVAMETKRTDIYLQLFDANFMPLADAVAAPMEDVPEYAGKDPLLLCGDGVERVRPLLRDAGLDCVFEDAGGQPHAREVARLAAMQLEEGGAAAFRDPPPPLYIRSPDVSPPKNIMPVS